jgi:polyhydroxyalkanoate synthase
MEHGPLGVELALARPIFVAIDIARRWQAAGLSAFGLGPEECPHSVAASGGHWRLRDYGGTRTAPILLIVAAPIKRPYIWDLSPSASAIRYCLESGLHALLLEWLSPSGDARLGLDEHVAAISAAIAEAARIGRGTRPLLMGHSLGGTLAAIYAAFRPDSIDRLCLLSAPICFAPGQSPFRDAIIQLTPAEIPEAVPFPGSLLSAISAAAAPRTFVWSRMIDLAASIGDVRAREIHARVERWAMDEVPLPGALVRQIVEWLYRQNRFCSGTLKIGQARVGPSTLAVPVLAIVNIKDEVAPLPSVKPLLDLMPADRGRIIEYAGEVGICLQHLGLLVGRLAFSEVWPQIVAWLRSKS